MNPIVREVLLEGKVGGLGLGSSGQDARRLLGEPQARGAADVVGDQNEIWKYGDLELSLHKGRVFLLAVYFSPSGASLPAAPAGLGRHITAFSQAELEAELQSERIVFSLDAQLTFGEQRCLVVGRRARILFDAKSGLVQSIQVTEV
jgi:hypothetical protein